MKLFFNIAGGILLVLGILFAAGAAGDCDGDCMENANSLLAMAIILFASGCSIILGFIFIVIADDI
tara:strand:- start:536 stop:733 length:198 start_codon:yes stop_codon:yes gene_type:complete